MGKNTRKTRRRRVAAAGVIAALAVAGSASAAFQALPPGDQVNNDQAAGINPNLGVNGEDPTNADVVGGALVAGKPGVPWSVFRQHEQSPNKDQIFSRSFAAANPLANGAWTTRGNGTVGGRSDSGPTHLFSGSLNFDQTQDGEAPAIDFAGAGRAVPWATWYEHTTGITFGANNIFASRFDAASNKWIFSGQGRSNGGGGPQVPSLNIRTDQSAENPSVAGGSAADATKPGPWVTWQETTTTSNPSGKDQIFVSRPEGPGQTNCLGVTPAAENPNAAPPGGFCFQQTGVPRVGPSTADPSLNVDPNRDGVEPDIAFTGKNAAGVQDGVPWVVWYEKGTTTTPGLHPNEMVFAAKGLADATAGRGGFSWTAVGSQNSALLDLSGANNFGGCAASATTEAGCSLNKNPDKDAEDPRVAGGTMNPANATVPWVAWAEDLNGVKQIFVSRLVGGTHFELANNGAPLSVGANDSTRPDITFSGNTPYVSWRENIGGGVTKGFLGHFINPANPTFVLDESNIPLAPTGTPGVTPGPGQADVREPISSGCTADPFNNDGQTCQGGAIGTPFFLFTNQVSSSVLGLFGGAYQSGAPATGAASSIRTNSANVTGGVNPNGASVGVSFQFGTTTSYGRTVSAGKTGPDNGVEQFTAQLTGLPAGTTIHYRAVATSDFAPPQFGADQTFKTAPAYGRTSVGRARVRGTAAFVRVSCSGIAGQQTCKLRFRMTITERLRGKKVIAITARKKPKPKVRKVTVTVGSAPGLTLAAGRSKTVKVSLNRLGKRLLASRHTLKVTLDVTQTLSARKSRTLSQTVTFKVKKTKKKHH